MAVRIHPTAIIEQAVSLGDGTNVWDNAHIRHGAQLGEQCIVGGKSYNAACQKRSNTLPCRCIVVRWSGGSLLSQRPHAPRCNRKQTQEYGRTWTVCPLLSQPGTAVALL